MPERKARAQCGRLPKPTSGVCDEQEAACTRLADFDRMVRGGCEARTSAGGERKTWNARDEARCEGGGGDEKGGRHSACTTQTPLQHVLHASSCAKSPITPCPHLGAATLNISRVGNSPAPIVSRIASVTPPSLSPAPYPAEQNKMRWQCFGNRHGNLAYQLEIVVREVFRCIHDSNASSPQDIHLGAKRAECFSSPLRHRGDMSRFLLT